MNDRRDSRSRPPQRRGPKPPPKGADAPRMVAADALIQVEQDGRFANLILPKLLREEQSANPSFTSQDAAFVSELVYGTIRRKRTLDAVLDHYSTRPLQDLDPPVRACLRMGAYQLLYTRVADHAAVAETVSVARELAGEGPSKTVNAVLRSVLRGGTDSAVQEAIGRAPAASKTGVQTSHPDWIVDAVREALRLRGLGEDSVAPALEANNRAAQVTLAARPGLVEPADLAEEAEDVLGIVAHQGNVAETAVILSGGDPGALPSLRVGDAGVQDEGSQLAALILANAPVEGEGDKRWLDLCAGPGGKAALLGAIARQRGARVTANEVSPRRAKLLERSVQALDNVDVTVVDGREFQADQLFDRVLVDAPCLGLGSLRRRPESRWRHRPEDLDELLPLQWDLLKAGIALTRPGGVLAWVTCSPHRNETIDQVQRALETEPVHLLNAHTAAEALTMEELTVGPGPGTDVPEATATVVRNTIQLWPDAHGTDAMFIALLRKEERG